MKRNLRRLSALLLSLLLTVSLAACGDSSTGSVGGGKLPTGGKSSGSQESDTPSGSEEKGYDDSLITETVSLDTSFKNEYGETCQVSVHLPQLSSDGAETLNQRIMDIWGDLAAKKQADFERECLAVTVGWESHWSGSLLSLVMTEEQPGIGPDYWVFHYDFAKEQEVSAGELLNQLKISEDTLRTALCRAAASGFDGIFSDGRTAAPEELALLRAKTLAAAADAVHDLPFYPNADGSLTAYLNICTPVAAGWSQWELNIPLAQQAAPLRTEADDVAVTVNADGTVEVLIEKGSRTEAYQEEYGFRCGKSYTIDGCYGNYKKLLVASVGPDYSPTLFLLTDSGTVEYIRLFDAFRFGKLVNHGPLYGVGVPEGLWGDWPKVVDFEAGAGEHISTVYAVMNDGSRYDLAEAVNTGGTLRPFDLSGSWEAFLTRPGSSASEYRMEIRPSGSFTELTFTDSVPGAGISVPYTGYLEYLGMNETGLLYGYTVTGPDGNDLVGTMALLPQDGTMMVTPAGGDALLDAPDGMQFVKQ